ncbi:unnamed protein product [Prorocentrum cordatum]|uniref:Uncharacterized protein n=1 Tax=Prorocentrum cordatum TaxID=2364126 RepID=A0ABN9TU14_9DINO|nr:unnamed protein product [Polarella glacialis]
MQSGTHAVLPFTAVNGPWTTERLAKTIPAFISALLKKLGKASGDANPLHVLANISYGLQTRQELGWPPLQRYPFCGPPAKEDKRAAASAAKVIAKRFAEFRGDLVGPYIGPYLETTLSRVAGGEKNPSKIMAQAVSYVETCLA